MAPGELPDDAAVFDFLDEFLRDLERGTRHPLTHYLARYKGHEEAIAGEYFAELERSGLSGAHRAAPAPQTNGAEQDPGRVGPYKLVRELGRGGQGAVWLAEDTRIARHVALKLLPAEFAALSQERRRRLQREAEVIAKLDHPSLCAVLDARIDGDRPYIAMRYVEGATLGEWIARAREAKRAVEQEGSAARRDGALRLAPRTAVEQAGLLMFFERTARALHAAHEAGVVHRDVKPQNVMVTLSGDPVVLDFGQARDETSDSFELTRSGDVMGTPAYMSPEQILGRREAVDRRSDVWSLGASLYEALTLARPFEAESVPALFLAIRGVSPIDPRTLNKALSHELAIVVTTALEKEPARRYASALEFAEDLRRVREYEPIRARPPSAWRVFRGWCQRHPAIAFSTLGSIVALSVGLAFSLYQLSEKNRALEHAIGGHLGQRADALLEEDPAGALELGIEAVERAPTSLTRASLFRALQACHLRALLDGSPARRALDCCISPDGRSIAVALDAGAEFKGGVRIHELETGKALLEVLDYGTVARAVRFSPDGTRLAFADAVGTVRVVDARSGSLAVQFSLPTGEARGVEFLGGGSSVAAWSDGGVVCVDARDGARRWSWTVPDGGLPERELDLAVHAGLHRVLAWTIDKREPEASRAWLIDGSTGALLCELPSDARITSAEFRRDGAKFVTGSNDGPVRLWRSTDGGLERAFEHVGPGKLARVLRWSPDGARLAAILDDPLTKGSQAWMVYAASGAATTIGAADVRVLHASFSPDGSRLATVGSDSRVRLWSGPAGNVEESFRSYFGLREVEWSRDGRRLVTLSNGATVSVWYAGSRPDVYSLRASSSPVLCACFAPDGERVVVASEDGLARVWATPSGVARAEPHGVVEAGELLFNLSHRDAVRVAAYSPDGSRIATASKDGSARIWSAADGAELARLLELPEGLSSLSFSHDGQHVAVRTDSRRAFLCDANGRLPAREVDSDVTAMAWRSSPSQLLTVHTANAVRSFDPQNGSLIAERTWDDDKQGVSAHANALAAPSDGKEIALACVDGKVRFLALVEGAQAREKLTFFPPQSIDYSADGTKLLVVGRGGLGGFRLQDLASTTMDKDKDETKGEIPQTAYHTGDVTSGGFSPDGRWVITTGKEGSALVRDANTGGIFAHFPGRGSACRVGAISPGPGPARALAAYEDGSVWIWPLDPLKAALQRKPKLPEELYFLLVDREHKISGPLEYWPRGYPRR